MKKLVCFRILKVNDILNYFSTEDVINLISSLHWGEHYKQDQEVYIIKDNNNEDYSFYIQDKYCKITYRFPYSKINNNVISYLLRNKSIEKILCNIDNINKKIYFNNVVSTLGDEEKMKSKFPAKKIDNTFYIKTLLCAYPKAEKGSFSYITGNGKTRKEAIEMIRDKAIRFFYIYQYIKDLDLPY